MNDDNINNNINNNNLLNMYDNIVNAYINDTDMQHRLFRDMTTIMRNQEDTLRYLINNYRNIRNNILNLPNERTSSQSPIITENNQSTQPSISRNNSTQPSISRNNLPSLYFTPSNIINSINRQSMLNQLSPSSRPRTQSPPQPRTQSPPQPKLNHHHNLELKQKISMKIIMMIIIPNIELYIIDIVKIDIIIIDTIKIDIITDNILMIEESHLEEPLALVNTREY
ncbi:MAG: hypothetical protein CXT73_07790 [Methanobacteriota archaeon]|nr:MAG: hypothetical protein CXT73_07790 [Euryarchaeota archaeon]